MRAISAVLIALLFPACASLPPHGLDEPMELPAWQGALYVGDPAKNSIVRQQSNTEIKCDDEKFGQMICMSQPDFIDLTQQIRFLRNNCGVK